MKLKLHETKNDLRAKTRRAMIDLLNQGLADVLDLGLQAKQAHCNQRRGDTRADTTETTSADAICSEVRLGQAMTWESRMFCGSVLG